MSIDGEIRKNFRWEQGVQYTLDIGVSREQFKKDLEAMERDMRNRRPVRYMANRIKSVFDDPSDTGTDVSHAVKYPMQTVYPYDRDEE